MMKQSAAVDMLKRIRLNHDDKDTRAESLGDYVAECMPHIREIIHQLEELTPDEARGEWLAWGGLARRKQ